MGAPRVIPAGTRHGRLVVAMSRLPGQSRVSCRCDCGTPATVRLGEWGKTRSCGCLRREITTAQNTTHGMAGTHVYMVWAEMVARCTRTTHKRYVDYGGRGITVCQRWLAFANFHADMGERPEGHSLDRIDNDRGYEPANCRWATSSVQATNRRRYGYESRQRNEFGQFMPGKEGAE